MVFSCLIGASGKRPLSFLFDFEDLTFFEDFSLDFPFFSSLLDEESDSEVGTQEDVVESVILSFGAMGHRVLQKG